VDDVVTAGPWCGRGVTYVAGVGALQRHLCPQQGQVTTWWRLWVMHGQEPSHGSSASSGCAFLLCAAGLSVFRATSGVAATVPRAHTTREDGWG